MVTRGQKHSAEIHFRQALCDALPYEDKSVDVVFSSMFLHELSHRADYGFFC